MVLLLGWPEYKQRFANRGQTVGNSLRRLYRMYSSLENSVSLYRNNLARKITSSRKHYSGTHLTSWSFPSRKPPSPGVGLQVVSFRKPGFGFLRSISPTWPGFECSRWPWWRPQGTEQRYPDQCQTEDGCDEIASASTKLLPTS